MDARLSRLIDDLQLRLPGVVPTGLQPELTNTLRDFFIETNVWKEDINIGVRPNVIIYDITPDTPSIPVRLMSLLNAQNRPVLRATMPDRVSLLLAYAPSTAETWSAKISLTVTGDKDKEGYPVFPKWVLDIYYEVILDGVLARMMSQTAKPYTNPQMASYHQKKYMSGKVQARHQSNQENIYGGQRWRYPSFAPGGSRYGSSWGQPQ